MNDNIAKLGFEIDTQPLARAGAEAQRAAQQMGGLGTASDRVGQQMKGAGAQAGGLTDQLGKVNGVLRMSTEELSTMGAALGAGGLSGALGAAAGMAGRLVSSLGPIGMAVAGVAALGGAFYAINRPLAQAADAAALMEARMRNALGSTQAAQGAMKALYEQTQQTGLGFNSAADAFLRVARNAEAIGATREQMLQLTDTVQKLGKASGASSGEVGSGLVQLGQALAAGRLNGDELRSIMENMPALAKAIADGLGVSVGQIRALGAAGELTSEKVFNAILKASEKANEEFGKLPQTVEQANQKVADNFERLLGNLGTKLNSSPILVGLANFGNLIVGGIADALQGPALEEQLANAERLVQRLERGVSSPRGGIARSQARIDEARAELQRLRELVEKERQAVADAEEKRLNAPFVSTVEAASVEFDRQRKELEAQIKLRERIREQIEGIRALSPDLRSDAQNAALPNLERQLIQAEQAVNKLAGGAAKARQSLADLRDAIRLGGGGGGTQIAMTAIQQARDAQAAGQPGSVREFMALGVEEAALRAQARIDALNRQADAQEKLAGATGRTRAEIRELEIAQEVANFRLDTFGDETGPKVERAVLAYEAALRRTKASQDGLADTKAFEAYSSQMAGIAAQMKVVELGAYAMREALMEARAVAADRQTPGSGDRVRGEFRMNERLRAVQQEADLERQIERLRQDADAAGNPMRQRGLARERSIEDAMRDVAPGSRPELDGLMRQRDEAEQRRDLAGQNADLQRQVALNRERLSLVGLTGEQLAVQTALLERRNQLEQQGIDLQSGQARAILASTEELAKQEFIIRRQQEQAQRYQQLWVNAARNIQEGLANAFENAFRSGEISGKTLFNLLNDMAIKFASNVLSMMVYKPLEDALLRFGTSLIPGGGAAAAGTGGPMTAGGFGRFTGRAFGGDLAGGNVIPFARGGVVSSPTVFGMASGGMAVAGEAGPEAVLPLKRGNDGRLGVASGGGGGDVSITVIDQRSGSNSEPVGVQESRGPDGRRAIQILVRDEVRRAIRSGDLDRDMQSSYGNQRRLVTR